MRVLSVNVFKMSDHGDGVLSCRASVTVEDNQGDISVVDSRSNIRINSSRTGTEIKAAFGKRALRRVAKQEERFYFEEITKGNSPFKTPAKFNNNTELLDRIKKIVDRLDVDAKAEASQISAVKLATDNI